MIFDVNYTKEFSMKKRSFVLYAVYCLFMVIGISAYAQAGSSSASVANRKTAVRYLQLAKKYALKKSWTDANKQAQVGLAYDESVADLWYIRAVSELSSGAPKSVVVSLVEKSLAGAQWVDYNRDNARILYADVLCSTCDFEKALSVLDTAPFIYSSDAEYIRIKSYYNLKEPDSLDKARSHIDAARKVYPDDIRFAELFFTYEFRQQDRSVEVQKIADSFIKSVPNYKSVTDELLLYVAIFSKGEDSARLLQSFRAGNHKAPLYAEYAFKAGLIDAIAALDAFYEFADKEISLSVLESFVENMNDKDALSELVEYFNSYNGTVLVDTNKDMTPDLRITYKRGRPQTISYDSNQDDIIDWTCSCDFGEPLAIHLSKSDVDIEYGSWPSVKRIVYNNSGEKPKETFDLVSESLSWVPFKIIRDSVLKNKLGFDFFVANVSEKQSYISMDDIKKAASSYTIPSSERENARIQVMLLDGVPQIAKYFSGDRLYAQALFEKGVPVMRLVDFDGDNLFETTEIYGYSEDSSKKYLTKADEMQVITKPFATAEKSGSGYYVKMIQIDRNADTLPDFTEEYTEGLGKVTTWDIEADGSWGARYIKYPQHSEKDVLIEDACFHQPFDKSIVTVRSENGVPVFVKNGERTLSVVKGKTSGFYWIERENSEVCENAIVNALGKNVDQGVSMIVVSGNERYLAVKIGKMIFGELLPPPSGN